MRKIALSVNVPNGEIWSGFVSDKIFKNLVQLKDVGGFLHYDIDVYDEVNYNNMGWYKERTNKKSLVDFLSEKVFFTPNKDLVKDAFIN